MFIVSELAKLQNIFKMRIQFTTFLSKYQVFFERNERINRIILYEFFRDKG